MKFSIRTKFTVGMVFLFIIILVLSIFSAYYLNKMSKKTSAILKENYLSVVYAREMSEGLTNINQEIISSSFMNKTPDGVLLKKGLDTIDKSFQSEKNNITEPGEDKLVSDIETGLKEYRDSVMEFLVSPQPVEKVINLQKKFNPLYQQLVLLSQMNGKAIEVKTDDAKISSREALTAMTILATLCFLIALTFTFNFATYFNERFYQLYNGIKEIVSSNYGQRLYFEGADEFYEISLVFNQMAEKLDENQQKMAVTLQTEKEKAYTKSEIQELKSVLLRIKSIEEQAESLISKLEENS